MSVKHKLDVDELTEAELRKIVAELAQHLGLVIIGVEYKDDPTRHVRLGRENELDRW